ncbi:YbaB/EbfC family nucleoid-associated protein [Micromonospora sp. HM5-17]|uniref:YbaB/EbfC family nucleoid-associated protein n=1 Tax=Micromonospora sp. HM5-17 TaxID=2487710 RepID=UPI0013152992|nr:YbaB/EbfC family nucleoid-associated protein [Micromonospora sp. HM5-17]
MWRDDHVDLAGLRDLQRQAEELAAQLSAAAAAAEAEFVGGDSAGAVEVTIDGSGAPVRVRLDRDWLRITGMSGLGPAVIDAVQAATNERLTAWATEASTFEGGPDTQQPTTIDRLERAEVGDPSSRQSMYAMRDLLDLVDGALEHLDRMAEAAESAATRSTTATNPTRTVRVTSVGGTVTEIDFDDEWLRSAHHERIADAIRDALAASWRAVEEERQRVFETVPGMERMRRLTASPEALLREVGLIR